ncbi:50S ribosomal protein L25/general stress protein Ctc [Natronoflexus pectinivorans]|uniref:Large ribosomal subunit protein bL25 n=1 Tax=Natronoflexus pectinivorans TaxID=682526 RepID=A0A4R2GN57_9BACT|nr:50S ribosomal protein L25/general stress protein Ctc [Natronoflexus pectinivorans]TCO10457.1 large subunit ribosomal protein L25 [Natronoflexus pectinivorans]
MQTIEVKAVKRDNLGKTATKELRQSGQVPGVLYGGKEVVHFQAEANEFRKLLFTPKVYIVKLNIEGTVYEAIIKDLQYHPVSDELIHIDFLQVFEDKPITIEVPVKLKGLAEGVKAGGKLTLEQRKLRVKGLMKNLPDELEINISKLGLGKGIQVGSLSFPELELLNAKNSVVVAVKLTRAARAAAQQQKG